MCLVMCSSARVTSYQTLTTFSLASSNIHDSGAEHMASALINNQVDIEYFGCGSSCVDLKCDWYWQTLTTLDLSGNEISERGAWHLAEGLRINQVRPTFSLHSVLPLQFHLYRCS